MPLREKARSLFRPRSRTTNSSNTDRDHPSESSSVHKSNSNRLSPASSRSKEPGYYANGGRWPSNVYKPGEPMPRPKYRTPAKKEHKEKLEAFSFADAWAVRKRSFNSQYSPMGTRAPSRRNSSSRPSQLSRANSVFSIVNGRKKSDAGRTGSVTSTETSDGAPGPTARRSKDVGREVFSAARPTPLETEVEQEGDDDVANVGLSRVQSLDRAKPHAAPPLPPGAATIASSTRPAAAAADHRPFTEQELAQALQRSRLEVPTY